MKTLAEKIAVMQAAERGEKIESSYDDGLSWNRCPAPTWNWHVNDYRVAREEPSIDWSAVAKRFRWLVVDHNGTGELHTEAPDKCDKYWECTDHSCMANVFSSFRPGNIPWNEAKPIKRPEGK